MTPRQRGHRDAAQGVETNPFDFKLMPTSHDAWVDARAYVKDYQAKGLDPSGHAPKIPHLCERDVTKVCNCCQTCGVACWAEQFEGTGNRIAAKIESVKDVVKYSVQSLLRKILRR